MSDSTPGRQPTARYSWVDAAKGLTIIVVVIYHADSWLGYVGAVADPVTRGFIGVLTSAFMAIFIALSGIFAGRSLDRPWREFFNTKLTVYVWPFLLWQIVVIVYRMIGWAFIPGYERTPTEIFAMAALSPLRPNGELWFLWALVLYLVIAKLVVRLPSWVVLGVAGVISASWTIGHELLPARLLEPLGPGLVAVPSYLFVFLAAVRWGPTIIRLVTQANIWLVGALAVAWALAAFCQYYYLSSWIVLVPIMHVVGVVGMMCWGRLLERATWLVALGARSLPIYLIHIILIVVITAGIAVAGIDVSQWGSLVIWATTIFAVVVGLGLYRYAQGSFLFVPPRWFRLPAAAAAPGQTLTTR